MNAWWKMLYAHGTFCCDLRRWCSKVEVTMGFGSNLETFGGFAITDFEVGAAPPEPAKGGVRLRLTYADEGSTFTDVFAKFIATPGIENLRALVIGQWNLYQEGDDAARVVELLIGSKARFPRLEALFIGDITSEENECSWIEQTDVSALWGAFPGLTAFGIRGANGLSLGRIAHGNLKFLSVEAGGLPRTVVHDIGRADLPALEHLEIWLGTPDYGGDSRAEDLSPILDGSRFPKLITLALRNCAWADVLAAAVVKSAILKRVRVLDLSMGTLGDAGAAILAASPAVAKLQKLDIHHHYVSEGSVERLKALGIEVNDENRNDPDSWDGEEHRYVAVSE
jgi:hypothetical protein